MSDDKKEPPEEYLARFKETLDQLANGEPTDAEEVKRQLLHDLNSKCAVVSWKGKTLILTEKRDPNFDRDTFELSTFGDFKNFFANRGRVGAKRLADWWLEHPNRREYESVAFLPGRSVPGVYNFWRGFGVEPAPGDCDLFLSMVRDVICSGKEELYKYVMAWCADAVQNPAERPGVVLVLKGGQGFGKGTLAREFGELFGAHFLHLHHAEHLTGRFNAHLANTLLLFADECFWAGDKQHESALKALITEPTVPIEYKNKDIITVRNHVRVVMASNKDWVVPAALDDRRFCVIDVSDRHAKDTPYFKAIHDQMKAGGAAALLDHLLKFDLSGIDLRAIPDTAARTEQQLRSLDPITAFWYARLNNGSQIQTDSEWREEIATVDLYEEFAREAKAGGERRHGHETAFGMQLRKMCPEVKKRGVQRDVCGQTKRLKVYQFPALAECRKAFEAFAGKKFAWDEQTGAVRGDVPEM